MTRRRTPAAPTARAQRHFATTLPTPPRHRSKRDVPSARLNTIATCTICRIALKVRETAGAEPRKNISDQSPASVSSAWLIADR